MLKQRILTALVLAPLMIGGIFFLPLQYFSYFIGAIVTLAAWEWANLSGFSCQYRRVAYATVMAAALFTTGTLMAQYPEAVKYTLVAGVAWWAIAFLLVLKYPNATGLWGAKITRALIGFVVLIPMWVGFVTLKEQANSSALILFLMFIIWGADTGAYFAGKTWGKSKLAPNVSPGKSWAGFWGGVATTLAITFIFGYIVEQNFHSLSQTEWIQLIIMGTVTTLVSVLGDLVESMFKRYRGIKDSSQLLPGHGGILDRTDSMASAVPVFAFFIWWFGWSL